MLTTLASFSVQTSPLTARTLETLIRLSTAHAKARLSHTVDERDAIAAEEILRFALFKEVVKPASQAKRRKVRRGNESETDASSTDEDDEDEDEDERGVERMEMPKDANKRGGPRRQPPRRATSSRGNSPVLDRRSVARETPGVDEDEEEAMRMMQVEEDSQETQTQTQTQSQVETPDEIAPGLSRGR